MKSHSRILNTLAVAGPSNVIRRTPGIALSAAFMIFWAAPAARAAIMVRRGEPGGSQRGVQVPPAQSESCPLGR